MGLPPHRLRHDKDPEGDSGRAKEQLSVVCGSHEIRELSDMGLSKYRVQNNFGALDP